MTLVDAGTGEVVTVLSETESRALTDRIKANLADTWKLVAEAYEGRVWLALDYGTWDAYVDKELGGRIAIPREERREIVGSLKEAGLSVRAIVAVAEVSRQTVTKDVREHRQVSQSRTPAPDRSEVEPRFKESAKPAAPTKGLDGKQYAPKPEQVPAPEPPQSDFLKGDKYRLSFHRDMSRIFGALNSYDKAYLADVADAAVWEGVDRLEMVVGSFIKQVRAAKPKLRAVGGES